ncbi:diguanylate cyclase [Aliikangiella sp. IMCC44359]|uniref:diguanylate cyclase n=1 Tax=Aliikangiella sp. IMCC44359 TaxID=3459125 RepID=UPI00403AEB13
MKIFLKGYQCFYLIFFKFSLLFFLLISPVLAEPVTPLNAIKLDTGWKFCPVQNFQPEVDPSVLNCKPINLPTGWESVHPNYDGYGLLYTDFEVSKEHLKKPLGIFINKLRDADKIFINDQFIGKTGEFPPHFEKAVLYSRLYSIPNNILKHEQPNTIKIWVYNDARPGGITHSVPIISDHFELLKDFYHNNYSMLAFIVILIVFSLLHFIYYSFHRHSKENILYAVFLLCWSAYLFTYSNLALDSHIPINLLFRSNVALFFAIFALFPLFIYQFFRQQIPTILKSIIITAFILIPICFLLPEPKLLYYPLQLVEVLTLPALLFVYWLLYKAVKAELTYAKLMTTIIVMYTTFGSIDIAIDLFQPENFNRIKLYTPKALIIVSIILTLIVSHKNFVYFRDATIDKLTGTLRYSEFLPRLDQELFRADREEKLLVVIMIDLDDFKSINDKFGHIQGDNVLKMVANCIRMQLRHFDLLCRFGGDEFCIAATLDNKKEIHNFVDRIHQAVNELNFEKNDYKETISATFGAEIRAPKQKASPQSLIESADNLLIVAKAKTKGTVFWQRSYPRISSSYSPPLEP